MEAIVSAFKGSKRSQRTTAHVILIIRDIDSREQAEKLVGKQVTWKTPSGKIISGEIRSAHGNSGALRAIFEKGLPGQALGTKADIGA